MGYYDEEGNWVEEDEFGATDTYAPQQTGGQDFLSILMALQGGKNPIGKDGQGTYTGYDQNYIAKSNNTLMGGLFSRLGVNPIEQAFPLGEKGTIPPSGEAEYFKQTTDPEMLNIIKHIDEGGTVAEIQAAYADPDDPEPMDAEAAKTYIKQAWGYANAKKKDYDANAQYTEQRRQTDPFGEENTPEAAAFEQSFPDSQSLGDWTRGRTASSRPKEMTGFQVRSSRGAPSVGQRAVHAVASLMPGGAKPGTVPEGKRKFTQVKNSQPRKRKPDAFDAKFAANEQRSKNLARWVQADYTNRRNSGSGRRPTPGNQNMQQRLQLLNQLLGG